MCFSATASFAAAGVLTAAGAVSLTAARRRRLGLGLTAFAAFPLLFGVQQAIEGLVWLGLEGALPAAWTPWTSAGFLFFALFLWPAAGPVTGWLIETRPARRRGLAGLAVLGTALGAALFSTAMAGARPPAAGLATGGHVVYPFDLRFPAGIELAYFVIASAAMIGSSNPDARLFGAALAASFALTLTVWNPAVLPSVWCYFAAICSLVALRAALRGPAPTGPAAAA